MTDLMLKTKHGTCSSAEDDCTTTGDCCSSSTKSVDYSVVNTEVCPTGYDHQVEDDDFSVARSEDLSRHAYLKDLCIHIETRLLLFQSSLDLFSDVRGPKPKSEQAVEVSPRPINETVTKAETIDETPKDSSKLTSQSKKKSTLKGCLRVRAEQGTCSTDEDVVTAELGLTLGRGKSVNPEDDVQADNKSGVDFSDVTVRTFACRLGDNPSASKHTIS